METYDANGDGLLSPDELKPCPALLANLSKYDGDGDGRISRDELVGRFDKLFVRGADLTSITCTVTDGRRPVAGAKLKFIPEAFLGDKVAPADGVTDSSGAATMAMSDSDLPDEMKGKPVAQVGIYRVEVDSGQGAKVFGHEVDFAARGGVSPTFDLREAS